MRRAAALAVLLLALGAARADTIDDLSRRLRADPDYKVRLSAALNLGKLGDRRAIPALTDALSDTDKAVRGVAAAALGHMIDAGVSAEARARAAQELGRLADRDEDSGVRAQARRALDAVRAIPAPSAPGAIFVEIGPVADPTKMGGPEVVAFMHRTISDTLVKAVPAIQTEWPGGAPDEAGLKRAGAAAFYVDASLAGMTVQRGSPTRVHCDLSVLVATYPGRSIFAMTKGNADVETSSSERAIAEAKTDCVRAVLEDLVASQVAPTIQKKAKAD